MDSEPTLKSGFGESNIITTSSYQELEFKDNSQVLAINESSRFGIQLDLIQMVLSILCPLFQD